MKSKTRERTVRHRNRLEGQIKAQAATDTAKALELAQHGYVLSPVERMVKSYLLFKPGKTRDELRTNLGEALLKAVDARDAEPFRVVASTLESSLPHEGDQLRANILAMKGVLNDLGQQMTIPKLADLLSIPRTDDGFRQLRQLCKDLAFPLRAAKRGRKLKIITGQSAA